MRAAVFAGFPGSGKTSLIVRLAGMFAARGVRAAVLENDAAPHGIDGKRLAESGLTVREVAAGCICCSLAGELAAGVRQLAEQANPDILVIEPSGMAAPQLVIRAVEGMEEVETVKAFVLVDGARWPALRARMASFVGGSLGAADAALITKIDRLTPRAIEKTVREITAVRKGLAVVPLSAVNGAGLERLLEMTLAETGKQSGKREAEADKRSVWKGEMSSLRTTRVFKPPLPAIEAERWLAAFLERLAAGIAAQAPAEVLGHVKCMGEANGKTVFASIDSIGSPAAVAGCFPGLVGKMRITASALMAGIQGDRLRYAMEGVFAGGEKK
jgi:G3E family GTPase